MPARRRGVAPLALPLLAGAPAAVAVAVAAGTGEAKLKPLLLPAALFAAFRRRGGVGGRGAVFGFLGSFIASSAAPGVR